MTIPHDSSKTSCFSSILRRLICSNGIPTHPSSEYIDNPNVEQTKLQPPSLPAPANIVARLMGLDSLPNSLHTSKASLGSLMRKSRSVGSLDFIPNFDITKQPHHRRLRTSVSYREDVTSTSFMQTSHNHDHDQISRKPKSTGLTPIQEKPNIVNKNRRQCQKVKVNNSKKQVSLLPKKITRKKVVDDGFPEKKNKLKSRSRRCNNPLPKVTKKKVVDNDKENKMSILKRRQSDQEYCIKVLMEVGRLTMEEIQGNDVWVVNDINEISYEIGHDILQLLVYEMVDELCISM